jgi:hypothetical protein
MRRSIFVLCLLTLCSGFALAQSKTVTNADLEKFRQKREAGERSLRAHYAKQGLTPADVAKREAADAEAREALSARFRADRLERERLEQERMEREMAPPQVNVYVPQQERNNTGYFGYENQYNPYFPSYPNYYPYGYPQNRRYENNGVRWRATPMGVIVEGTQAPVQQYPRPSTYPWRNRRPR